MAMDLFNSSDFDTLAHELSEEWHVPGLAISFVQGDNVASKAYGVQAIDIAKRCNADSLFDIASCSKSFTAAAVGILVEDDDKYPNIQWDTPMSKLLPADFVMAGDEYTQGITVEDILSHRTGLPGHDESYLGQSAQYPDTPASVTRNLRNLPINAPIRSKYQYCNMMYTVATHLVEAHAKTSFADFLRQHFFQPLGMSSTYLHHSTARAAGLESRLTKPHSYQKKSKTFKTINWPIDPEAQGAGSICTSVNDMAQYIRAIINGTSPFSSHLLQELTKPRIIADPNYENFDPLTSFCAYALGWEITFYRGHRVVRHDGSIDGFVSAMFFLPELQIGGTVLANSSTAWPACHAIVNTLIDAALSTPSPLELINWPACVREKSAKQEAESTRESNETRTALFLGGQTEPESLTTPLELYTGPYHHAGYHTLTVQIKDGALFVDACDRSMGFTLTFEHICEQKVFLIHYANRDDDEQTDEFRGEFELVDSGKGTRAMLLQLEPEMTEMIRFDKVRDTKVDIS